MGGKGETAKLGVNRQGKVLIQLLLLTSSVILETVSGPLGLFVWWVFFKFILVKHS